MTALRVALDGLGLWAPGLGDLAALRAVLDGQEAPPPPARPPAATLPANERRRAPESVLLAAEVAAQAVAMSGHQGADLACVFSSSHGDQAITDYMCATLANAPTELSPTKFHNSVHNAPVGYWTIATGCHVASNAVCAHRHSFGAGLLEAASLALADARPVLLVCSDTGGGGPLEEMTRCSLAFGAALVLAPHTGARTLASLSLSPVYGAAPDAVLPAPFATWREGNPSAAALDLLLPLLRRESRAETAAGPALTLQLAMEYPG